MRWKLPKLVEALKNPVNINKYLYQTEILKNGNLTEFNEEIKNLRILALM